MCYGIPDRRFVTQDSQARTLIPDLLARIPEPYIRLSLELQQAFGLRREEAIKFIPSYADQGDKIQLKPSWTKGGKAREIPIRNDQQREILKRAHQLAGRGSLIPGHRRYIDQLRLYERYTLQVGLSNMHGLRHAYAQQRYQELTGWPAPAAGGPKAAQLTPEQKIEDQKARMAISQELGHVRTQILVVYCGK